GAGDIFIYEPSGVKRIRIGGNGTAAYIANDSDIGFHITQGANPNFGFNAFNASSFGNSAGGVMGIKDGSYPSIAPTGGGVLMSIFSAGVGGQGVWVASNGHGTTFGPAGPHCGECGYDFWTVVGWMPEWGAYLAICGWCGAKYKKGPKTVFSLLDKQQASEIINKRNAMKLISGGMDAKTERPRKIG